MRARYRFSYLAILLSFVCSLAAAAQSTITNGQMLSGSVTSTTPQNWTFMANAGLYVCASTDYTVTNYQVQPKIDGVSSGTPKNCVTLSTSGSHTIAVATNDAAAPATPYTLGLYISQIPYAVGQGGTITDAVAYTSNTTGALLEMWNFVGTTGDAMTLSVTSSSFTPIIQIFKPDGTLLGNYAASHPAVTLTQTGNYVVLTSPYTADQHSTLRSFGFGITGLSATGDAKADGAFCLACSLGGAAAGDPINVATGNLYEEVTDYTTAGANPLAFSRYYNSQSQQHGLAATSLGPNWRSNFDRILHVLSTTVITAERPDGRLLLFSLKAGAWTPETDVDYKLTAISGGYKLTDPHDVAETYAVTGSLGQLQSIAQRNGYTQTLTYTTGQLTNVTDSYSRTLTLSYTGSALTGVTTPDTLALSYGYTTISGASLLTSVGYNTSPTTSQTYLYENTSFPFALTGITDENGNRYATWAYDSYGRANSSQHAGGAGLTQIAYDDSTGNRTVTGPLGIADTYKYSLLQGVSKLTEVDRAANGSVAAASRTQGFDANGYLNSKTDWNGNSTTYVNNTHGQPTTINEAVGSSVARTTTIAYDPTWVHEPATITTTGLTTGFTYDPTYGYPLTKTLTDTTASAGTYAAATRVWHYTWSNYGLLASVQNPRTDITAAQATTAYGYTAGTLTSITNGLSQTTTINTYTPGGRPLTMHDPNGVLTTMTYSPRQWLLTSAVTTAAGVRTTTYGRDAAGNLTSTQLPDNSTLTNTLDAAQRLTKITDSLGNSQNFTLDALGDATAISYTDSTNRARYVHSDSFDAVGHVATDTRGTNRVTTYTRDNNGNATGIVDPDSHPAVARVFDALNRLHQVTDSAGGVTTTNYDSHDRPTSIVTPNGATTTYTYTGFGDLAQEVSPDRGTTLYHYDGQGNRTSKTDALGILAVYAYDPLDRRTSNTYPAPSTDNVAYTYDETGHGFGIGRLTSMTDPAGTLSRSYDERGNLLSETRTRSGSFSRTTSYGYNPASRLSTITYPSGAVVTQNFNAVGRISSISLKPTSSGASQTILSKTGIYPFGPDVPGTFGNGVQESRGFDADYRTVGVYTNTTSNGYVQYVVSTLDGNGNLTSTADSVNSANSQTLTYDNVDRLLTASGGYGSESFSYDSNGNRLTAGSTTNTYTANTNRLTAVAGQTVTTNANGNITGIAYTGSPMTFTYNQANRLAAVGSALSYVYDGFGQRIAKTDTIQRYLYYGQDGKLLESSDNTGTALIDYVYLDDYPVATFVPNGSTGTLSFIHSDRLKTPVAITNASQGVGWSIHTDQFGAPNSVTGNSIANDLRFPGQEYELASGHNHNGFRDYAPGLGRYLETDPIGLQGGVNTFAYAGNSPGRFVDPKGLDNGEQYGPPAPVYGPPEKNPSVMPGGSNSSQYGPPEQYGPPAPTNSPLGDRLLKAGSAASEAGGLLSATPNAYAKAAGATLVGLGFCADVAGNILNDTPGDAVQGMAIDKATEGIPGGGVISQFVGMMFEPWSDDGPQEY